MSETLTFFMAVIMKNYINLLLCHILCPYFLFKTKKKKKSLT